MVISHESSSPRFLLPVRGTRHAQRPVEYKSKTVPHGHSQHASTLHRFFYDFPILISVVTTYGAYLFGFRRKRRIYCVSRADGGGGGHHEDIIFSTAPCKSFSLSLSRERDRSRFCAGNQYWPPTLGTRVVLQNECLGIPRDRNDLRDTSALYNHYIIIRTHVYIYMYTYVGARISIAGHRPKKKKTLAIPKRENIK